jgi:aryl-alcohol dehydrogenase-like predicted oxidoreductase
VSVQNKYNIANRKDDDVLAACEKAGLAFIPWYPLGAGSVLRSAGIQRIAARRHATTAQVAIAWLVARSPAMLPIPGTRSIAHLEENAAAGTLELSPEDLSNLDRV